MDWLKALQLAFIYGPSIKAAIDEAVSNDDLATKVKAVAKPLVAILEDVGTQLFPKAASSLRLVGGVIAAFDPNVTKWVQGSLNTLLSPSPNLAVDGIYGPRTRAAVERLQEKLGLVVDGLAGSITRAAIEGALAKL